MFKKVIITPAVKQAVTLSDFEEYEGISHNQHKGFVSQLIKAVIEEIESKGVHLIEQTIKLIWDEAPNDGVIVLHGVYPVSSVDSIYYVGTDDVPVEFDSSYYEFDDGHPSRVILKYGNVWPSGLRNYASFYVNVLCGFGTESNDVPQNLRFAVMQTVSDWYENRNRFRAKTFPDSVLGIINRFSCPVQ